MTPLTPRPADPPWLVEAWRHLDKTETQDAAWVLSLPAKFARWVQAYYVNTVRQPWCALFVSSCLADVGITTPPNPLGARAYLDWGVPVTAVPAFWQRGTIVVLSRLGGGHVGFYLGTRRVTVPGAVPAFREEIALLSGNQSNGVRVAWFPASRVLGARWPTEFS